MNGRQCYTIYKPGTNPGIIELSDVDGLNKWKISEGKPPRYKIDYQYMFAHVERMVPWMRAVYLVPCLADQDGKGCSGVSIQDTKTLLIKYGNETSCNVLDTLYHEIFHAVQDTLLDSEREELYETVWNRSIFYDDDYLDAKWEITARQFASLARFLDDGGFIASGHDKTTEFMIKVYTGEWARKLAEWKAVADEQRAKAERRARLLNAARNLVFG